jgi:biopolymer transport protein ExbD
LNAVLGVLVNLAMAQAAPVRLHVLVDRHLRFENGPEIDPAQLQSKLRSLKRHKPRPVIDLQLDGRATYDTVAKTLTTLQQEHYPFHCDCGGLNVHFP